MRGAAEQPLVYEPEPLADIHAPGLYVLRGPRRVGKSLELKRAIARLINHGVNPRTIFFCACDGLGAQDLRRMIRTAHARTRSKSDGMPAWWFLDEVTSVRQWSTAIKQLRDQDKEFREACVVLTGSSARDLSEATKALADRRGGIADSDRLLLPKSFRSFCQAIGGYEHLPEAVIRPRDMLTHSAEAAVMELEPCATKLDDAWQLYLSVGGFPRAVGIPPIRRDTARIHRRALGRRSRRRHPLRNALADGDARLHVTPRHEPL